MIQAVREASDEANAEASKLLARYYEDHPELAAGDAAQAMNDFNVIRVAVGADVERRVRPVLDRYEQTACVAAAARELAACSVAGHPDAGRAQRHLRHRGGAPSHFMAQVSAYHSEWRDYFVPLIFHKAQLAGYTDLPVFAYHDEPTGAVVSGVGASAIGLALPALLLGAAGWRQLRRYPVVG